MSDRSVTVARFTLPVDAQLARAKLKSAGIDARILDEHTVSVHLFLSNAIGGVRLQVAEADLAQARVCLADDAPCWLPPEDEQDVIGDQWQEGTAVSDAAESERSEPRTPVCPSCRSDLVQAAGTALKTVVLSLLLLGIPLFFQRSGWECRSCGHHWKD